jgi:hypothetical protein
MNNDKINRMTAKEYYKSSRMVETRNWTLEMALNFAEEYTEALRIHDVVGQTKHLPEGENPESVSAQQTLLKVWNETAQEYTCVVPDCKKEPIEGAFHGLCSQHIWPNG